jgi:hypothetical protein
MAALRGDPAELLLYDRGELTTVTVAGLAGAALDLID